MRISDWSSDVCSSDLDRGGESITLRPEFTAGIARAYVTNGWQQFAPLKIATHGPLFRYERPQKGRYRQFHQLDAEVLGSDSPLGSEEHTSELQSLMRISYAAFCLKKKTVVIDIHRKLSAHI